MGFKILAINPGSTSTKIALYDDEQPTLALTLRHSAEEIARFPRIIDQLDWRKDIKKAEPAAEPAKEAETEAPAETDPPAEADENKTEE